MSFRAFKIRFVNQDGMRIPLPSDALIHQMACQWAEKSLDYPINFADFQWTEIVCRIDDDGTPLEVMGCMCGVQKWDFPVVRYTDPEAGRVLFDRVEGTLHDLDGRGSEIFLHVSRGGNPENVCPVRMSLLKEYKAVPSNRWSKIVR